MKKNLYCALIALCMFSCSKFDETLVDADEQAIESTVDEEMLRTRSGEASNLNPYSLSNIQTAYNKVLADKGDEPITLQASHKYLRILPQDSLQMYFLTDSLFLELFTYPLDRILTKDEIEFYSNDLINDFPWQYTIIPHDFNMPSELQVEILDDIYLQGLTTSQSTGETTKKPIDSGIKRGMKQPWPNPQITIDTVWEEVVQQAFADTGNGISDDGPSKSLSVWYPSAKITYIDDVINTTIPLEGIRIRVSTFLNVGYGYTNSNGEVSGLTGWGGKFRNPVRYQIIFENFEGKPKWNLREGTYGQAKIDGPSTTSRWEHTINGVSNITENRRQSAFAATHLAVWNYSRKQAALTNCGRSLSTMNIGVKWDKNGDNRSGRFFPWVAEPIGFVDQIIVYGKYSTGTFLTRGNITSIVSHELGHASHWQASIDDLGLPTQFIGVSTRMRESYANACEYYLMQNLYPNHFLPIIRHWSYDKDYSGIGEALMNHGLTINDIERTFIQSYKWDKWKEKVKSMNRIDDVIVDMLFDNANLTWNRNISQCIEGQDITYENTTTRYTVTNQIRDNGITVNDWTLPDGCTEVGRAENNSWIDVRFSSLGNRLLTAELLLLDSITFYTTSKNIQVASTAVLSGTVNTRIGHPSYYTLSNNSRTVTWVLQRSDNGVIFSDVANESFMISNQTNSSCNVYFYLPGTWKLRAMTGVAEIANIIVNVPKETTSSISASPEFRRIYSYKHFGVIPTSQRSTLVNPPTQDIQHQFTLHANHPGFIEHENIGDFGVTNLGVESEFYVLTEKLLQSHTYYNVTIPIYECFMSSNGENKDKVHNYNINSYYCGGSDTSCEHKIFGYIFSFQVTGSVPIYRVKEDRYVDELKVYEHFYLTRKNVVSEKDVTNWVTFLGIKIREKDWTEVKNLGVVGYSFPAQE